jgi:hypothetical protein
LLAGPSGGDPEVDLAGPDRDEVAQRLKPR